jgi:hypothetical protein
MARLNVAVGAQWLARAYSALATGGSTRLGARQRPGTSREVPERVFIDRTRPVTLCLLLPSDEQ